MAESSGNKKQGRLGKKINPKEKHAGSSPSRRRIAMVFIIAILLTVTIAEIAYFFYKIAYVKAYDVIAVAGNKVGLNIDVENNTINFGIAPPAGSIKRDLVVVNTGQEPLGVKVASTGAIKEFFYTDDESFILDVGANKSIGLIVKFPKEVALGNYTGKIILIFTRV